MINDLKILLKTFRREEISPKRFAKVIVKDPILLLAITQIRSSIHFRKTLSMSSNVDSFQIYLIAAIIYSSV
jgi:hypothetical protein